MGATDGSSEATESDPQHPSELEAAASAGRSATGARHKREVALDRAGRATSVLTAVFSLWIALVGAMLVVDIPWTLWQFSPLSLVPADLASDILYYVFGPRCVVLATLAAFLAYLFWLYRAYVVGLDHLGASLPFTPSVAVDWCFIPVMNLWKSYRAVRDLYLSSNPSDLPLPVIVKEKPNAGYRDPARQVSSPEVRLPRVPLLLWWMTWAVGFVAKLTVDRSVFFVELAASVSLFLAGIFTVVVARGVHACQRERARRMDALERRFSH